MASKITFFLNGKRTVLRNPSVNMSLADYLRTDEVRLMGTKHGDQDGYTGADNVVVAHYDSYQERTIYRTVSAVLTPLVAVDQRSVITVEGLGTIEKLHAIQERMYNCSATQCGFCSGGFVMSMYSLLRNNEHPKVADIEEALDGNVCRCTGYRPIAAAIAAYAEDVPADYFEKMNVPVLDSERFDAAHEPALPRELDGKALRELDVVYEEEDAELNVVGTATWVRPATLKHLLKLHDGKSLIVGGCTRVKPTFRHLGRYIETNNVPELNVLGVKGDELVIGAATTVQRLADELTQLSEDDTQPVWGALSTHLRRTLNQALRNMATIGGELCAADRDDAIIAPLIALGAQVTLTAAAGERVVPLEDFIRGVDTTQCRKLEVVRHVAIPLPRPGTALFVHVGSRRKTSSVPFFVSALALTAADAVVSAASYIVSGCPEVLYTRVQAVEKALVGATLNDTTAARVLEAGYMQEQWGKASIVPDVIPARARLGGVAAYMGVHQCAALLGMGNGLTDLDEVCLSIADRREHKLPLTIRKSPAATMKHVGRPIRSKNDKAKWTGTCTFPSDHTAERTLHGAFVYSPVPHGILNSIDTSACATVTGFHSAVTAADIPGMNQHSGIMTDTKVFVPVGQEVTCTMQRVAMCLAETPAAAYRAAELVQLDITPLPALLSIKEAMEANSYHNLCGVDERVIKLGDVERGFAEADHVVWGEFTMAGQDHFYMETHTCQVVPIQDNQFRVQSSTQNPSKVQFDIATALNIPNSDVHVEVDQIGGGFGGKQDRPCILATAAAVASKHCGRPVRMQLRRTEDMAMSGGRHPFHTEFKVGLTREGKFTAITMLSTCDGGNVFDVTAPVLDKCTFQAGSTYYIPNMRVEGRAAKTNHVTNTAFRGFGGPQATMIIEAIVDHVARETGIDGFELRDKNILQPGDRMLTGTYISTNYAEGLPRRIWDEIIASSEYKTRRAAVDEFNRQHKFLKRGIAVTPFKNGSLFEDDFMNQASAAVNVYRDGTATVCHSGVEMGQGLHQKLAQVAADALRIDISAVRVIATDTAKCPNTQPTAASSGQDINGPAVKKACEEIAGRLEPLRRDNPDKSFADICNIAYFTRVDMGARAFHILPSIHWQWDFTDAKNHSGYTGYYYDYGACVAEVELNTLTGDHRVVRCDLLEDAGLPMNPIHDFGQIEGGFTQGLGLFLGEYAFLNEGHFVDYDSKHYAVPMLTEVPTELHTTMLDEAPCEGTIHQAKNTAEAPLLLGAAAAIALKNAVAESRKAEGPINMPCPYTPGHVIEALPRPVLLEQ
ncbi:Xanthine dehydrogenase [Carpediemonas membranifera]|uniref:Xanthine dehydrogenase n=1 Tax=Carpediemonas membranifera TaxID=201153 RepID=A0A8J6E170_9EUKA|nr:Xanthine dehydrogenase [Carpediemonas membranifera]|eukprot:KAG9392711.1 Xanthine dehydrogenase [Carpediemonas membranifera]